jgi:hypothetical protein
VFTKRIHVFKAGDQTSAQGVQRNFSDKDLQQVVDTYDPTIHEAPLVIGHAGDNDSLPSFGWIKGFKKQGGNLYADVEFTDTAKDLVKDGHYRKVSISFYSPESAINPHKGQWSARHLALLGASPPAVKGLEPFSFAEVEGVYDFAVALSPSDIFDEALGPTLISEKSPLEMLREKLDAVRQDVSGAVRELQENQQGQTTEESADAAASSIEQPDAAQMANPDAPQFKETSKHVGRKGTEIAQQTADLEDQFPEEEFMDQGQISRKHAKGAHGQVMQVVENVYDEAHKESTAERKEAADRGFEAKRQKKEGHKGEAHETKELMKMKDEQLADEHGEMPAFLKKKLAEEHGEMPAAFKKNMEKMKAKAKGSSEHSEDEDEDDFAEGDEFGRYETARSSDNGYVDRMKVGKQGADGDTGRMKTSKSGEQDRDRMNTAKENAEFEGAQRMKTAKSSQKDADGESRWAGQEDGYDQATNMDQYDDGADDYGVNKPGKSDGDDAYGRDSNATKFPTESEEMPDDEVFAVQTTNVMSDKNMRVLRQTSSQARKGAKGGAIPNFGEPEPDEETSELGVTAHGEGAGKPSKAKQLTPGGMDTVDDPAETVGPDGAFAERGEKKATGKQLTPGAQDSVTNPAETVGPGGAFAENGVVGKKSSAKQLTPGAMDTVDEPAETSKKSGGVFAEEHAEGKKNPYTKTGFGSTYEEGEGDSGVDEGEEDYNELSADHCGMNYGMGSMGQARAVGFPQQMYEELKKLKAEHAELQKMYMEKEISHRKGKIANFVEALYEEGRLTDGVMPQSELQSYCEGLEFGTLEFSEGETAATKLLNLLGNLPPMVSFGEVAGGTFQYSEEDLDPHQRALKMVEKGEASDYVEALKRTMYS